MSSWPVESKQEKENKLILFLISPFVAFLYSLRSMNTRSSYAVFLGFSLCFGMAFSVQSYESAGVNASGIDAGRYRLHFEQSANIPSAEFFKDMKAYFKFDEGEKDFYLASMMFLVSRFTHNYHWLFLSLAFVFAFFQLKSLKFLTDNENWENTLFCVFLACFFAWNQIFNINAMRYYTAAWIAVYSILEIFINNKKIYFVLLFTTPFFHFSFWLIAGIVSLAYLLKRMEWFWIVVFGISFFSSTVLAEIINISADNLPDFIAGTVRGYTDVNRMFEDSSFSGSGFWWVPMVFDRMYKIYTNLLVVLLIVQRKNIRETKSWNLYLFIIIFMTFINFAMPIPALGTRSIVMTFPIIAYLWLENMGKVKYKWLIYAFPFVWAFKILTYVGFYKTVLDWQFIVSSPFYMIYKYLIIA